LLTALTPIRFNSDLVLESFNYVCLRVKYFHSVLLVSNFCWCSWGRSPCVVNNDN